MGFFRKSKSNFPTEIELTRDNLDSWPIWKELFESGKVLIDAKSKLRYPHGAPVGKLILTQVKKNGTPIYQESATEWFDPESEKAKQFVWPE